MTSTFGQQPVSPDNDTTPFPASSPTDIQPLIQAFGPSLIDYSLAYVCGAIAGVSIFGIEPFAFMNSWSTNLVNQANDAFSNAATAIASANTANAGVSTISSGVSGNVTGASVATNPNAVGPAVQLLNATVQAIGNTPQVNVYNQAGTWPKPAGAVSVNLMLCAAGGAGAQGGILIGSYGAAGGGGGPGGYSLYAGITASSLPSTAAVVVGVGGTGGDNGGASYSDSFQRANSTSGPGSNYRTDSVLTGQILNNALECLTPANVGETGAWNTWIAGALDTDTYLIQCQLAHPTDALATNNYTGVYCAAPATWTSSSKLVAFVASTNSGCGIFTQLGPVQAPYIANGTGTGQTTVATSTQNCTVTSVLGIARVGNVFYGLINGVVVCTWTDSGNTVPTGVGNRQFGAVVEGNFAFLSAETNSPAIDYLVGRDLGVLSQAGTAGGNASFNGSAYQVTGGAGGVGGGVDSSSTRRPATGSYLDTSTSWNGSAGSGNQTTTASGGCGAGGVAGFTPDGQNGGNGYNTSGGLAGTAASLDGQPGTPPNSGVYGPASGGGGGFFLPTGSLSIAGAGGVGGFPGGGGAGGGATQDAMGVNGTGAAGGDAQVVATTFF